MKKALCVRVSSSTYQKLQDLIKNHGTLTQAVAFAVDSLWGKEFDNGTAKNVRAAKNRQ